MLGRGIAPNVVLPHLARLSRGVWSRAGAERAEAEARGREVRLKYDRLGQSVATLSGGNQQKVVFARAWSRARRVWRFWMSRRAASMWARGPTSTP
jgi:ribose transport system ATP-binding protein